MFPKDLPSPNFQEWILQNREASPVFALGEYLPSSSTNFFRLPILHNNNSYNNCNSDTGGYACNFCRHHVGEARTASVVQIQCRTISKWLLDNHPCLALLSERQVLMTISSSDQRKGNFFTKSDSRRYDWVRIWVHLSWLHVRRVWEMANRK